MFLKSIHLANFKSHEAKDFYFAEKINCITGNNGVGKTNLLDAIHYLCLCKSYFNNVDAQNILHDRDYFTIEGFFTASGVEEKIFCGARRNQKKIFKRNETEYEKLGEHIGLLPIVITAPADSELITGGSDERRRFLDTTLSQTNNQYLQDLNVYNRLIAQRNAQLKDFAIRNYFDESLLQMWDEKIGPLNQKIHAERKEFLDEMETLFRNYYSLISGDKEPVEFHYHTKFNDSDYYSIMIQNLSRDRVLQHSTTGIHRDDIDFMMRGVSLKKFASQGQQKSFLLSLRLAQYDYLKQKKNTTPLFILDDVFDKLDEERSKNLLKILTSDHFGQVFITHTSEERLKEILKDEEGVKFNVIVND